MEAEYLELFYGSAVGYSFGDERTEKIMAYGTGIPDVNRTKTSSVASVKHSGPTRIPGKTKSIIRGCVAHAKGLIFALLSALSFAGMVACVANIATVSIVENFFFQMLAVAIGSAVWIVASKKDFFSREDCRVLLWLSYFCGVAAAMLFLVAAINMNYSDATAIYFSAPIFIGVLAYVLLKEPCGLLQVASTFLVTAGMLMIIRPKFLLDLLPFGCKNNTEPEDIRFNQSVILKYAAGIFYQSAASDDIIFTETARNHTSWSDFLLPNTLPRHVACILAVIATLCLSIATVLIRKCNQIDPAVVTFQYSVFGLVISGILNTLASGWTFPSDAKVWGLLSGAALFAVFAYGFNMAALYHELALLVSLVKTTEIVFAFILELLVNGRVPQFFTVIGAFVIISMALTHGVLGIKSKRSSKSTRRRKDYEQI